MQLMVDFFIVLLPFHAICANFYPHIWLLPAAMLECRVLGSPNLRFGSAPREVSPVDLDPVRGNCLGSDVCVCFFLAKASR